MTLIEVRKGSSIEFFDYCLNEEAINTGQKVIRLKEEFKPKHRVIVTLEDKRIIIIYDPDAVCYKEEPSK